MELIKKLPEYKIDYKLARDSALEILEKYNFPPQLGLTNSRDDLPSEDRVFESVGSLVYNDKPTKFKETDFTIFNEEYKNTYFYEIYKSIPDIGRFRIMHLEGPKCYTIHRDQTRRYHYVIETNPDCLFLFPGLGKQIHIPKDETLHIVDTRFRHTFVNGSRKRRIHLVMDDLSTIKK